MAELAAVILAAGRSRRMGENKLLLPLGDATVLEQFLRTFPYELFQQVILVVADQRVGALGGQFPLTICQNDAPEKGKSHSIRLGLGGVDQHHGVMFLVADQPLLKNKTIQRLVQVFAEDMSRIVVPEARGQGRNPVIFPQAMRSELNTLQGDDGGRLLIARYPQLVRPVRFDDAGQFVDIDGVDTYHHIKNQWA